MISPGIGSFCEGLGYKHVHVLKIVGSFHIKSDNICTSPFQFWIKMSERQVQRGREGWGSPLDLPLALYDSFLVAVVELVLITAFIVM